MKNRKLRRTALCAAVATFALALTLPSLAKGSIIGGSIQCEHMSEAIMKTDKHMTVEVYSSDTGTLVASQKADGGSYNIIMEQTGKYDVKVMRSGFLPSIVKDVVVGDSSQYIKLPTAVLEAGDVNGDGVVDIKDKLFMYRKLSGSAYNQLYLSAALDINGDGKTDDADLTLMNTNMGKTASEIPFDPSFGQSLRRNNYPSFELVWNPDYATTSTKDNDGQMESGWTHDNRGGVPKSLDVTPYTLSDISDVYPTAFVRDLTVQTEGVLTLKTAINISGSDTDGAGIMFTDSDGKTVYQLISKGNVYCTRTPDGSLKKLDFEVQNGVTVKLYVVIDIDNQTSHTYISGVDMGVNPLCGGKDVATYKIFTTEEANGVTINPYACYINANYGINEDFWVLSETGEPYGWTFSKGIGASISASTGELVLSAAQSESSYAKASAKTDRMSGIVIYESLEYMDAKNDGMCLSLKYGEKDIVKLYTTKDAFYANGTLVKDSYYGNFWNDLRIEADTDTNTAKIKINGKVKATVPFLENALYLDGFDISYNPTVSSGKAVFDDVQFYQKQEVSDYVPVPVKPTDSNDYYVGMNMCNLWKNGEHWGWDNITPYAEAKSVLGRYDEDLPEVADWEIKFMVEHGIDYQAICWYGSETNAPIKDTRLSGGLNKAYFNSEYGDMMQFAILWEAINAARPVDMNAWKSYFVPYWLEYYLSDPNYARVDNRAVIGVFGPSNLWASSCFGSIATCREALDYLEDEAKKIGYDGIIYMACSTTSGATDQTNLANAGFDCIYAYNYGRNGYDVNTTINSHNAQHKTGKIHVVPTISVGFNRVGWGDYRSPMMSTADMKTISEWARDTVFGSWYANESESWKRKLMMYSTWNEYGEGTYIMPSGVNGFGYLDTIKSVFTDNNTPSVNAVPDENQLSRLGYLFPQYRQTLRPGLNGKRSLPTEKCESNYTEYSLTSGTSANTGSFYFTNCSYSYDSATGSLKVSPTNTDPMLQLKNNLSKMASSVPGITVTAKIPKGETMQIYFSTSNDTGLSESKSVRLTSDSDDMKDYYLDMSSNPYWNGNIYTVRLDPVGSKTVCYVKSIRFHGRMNYECFIDKNAYYLDAIYPVGGDRSKAPTLETGTYPAVDNGNTLFPFHPDMGAAYMLNVYYVWRFETQTLTIYGGGSEIAYTMGSSIAMVNGQPTDLGCTPQNEDGIPMIPLEKTIEFLGEGYSLETVDDGTKRTFNITTPNNYFWGYTSYADKLHWEFNQPGNNEGWSIASLTTDFTQTGCMAGRSTATGVASRPYDPVYQTDVNFKTKDYNLVKFRMKCNIASNNVVQLFYYGTDANGGSIGISEGRSIRLDVLAANNDKFVEYTADMSGVSAWNAIDTITNLRFDPINCAGTFAIDYIRIYESDSAYTYNFNTSGDHEGWSLGFITEDTSVTGALAGTSTFRPTDTNVPYDPMIMSPDFFADSTYFNKIDVTMKYNIGTKESSYIGLFFQTSDMSSFAGGYVTTVPLKASDGANYVTYTFDMSGNAKWAETGWVKKLRIDPIDCEGSFAIDKIRIYHG